MTSLTLLAAFLLSFAKEPPLYSPKATKQQVPGSGIEAPEGLFFNRLDDSFPMGLEETYATNFPLITEKEEEIYTFTPSKAMPLIENYLQKAKKYEERAQQYKRKKKHAKAKKYILKGIKTLKKALKKTKKNAHGNPIYSAEIYHEISIMYQQLTDLPKAIDYLIKAWEIYSLHRESYSEVFTEVTKELSTAYYIEKNYPKAIEVIEPNLLFVQNTDENDPLENSKTLYNLGHLHEKNGNYSQAEVYHREALAILTLTDTKNDHEKAVFYDGLASTLLKQKKYKEAQKYYLLFFRATEGDPHWENIKSADNYNNLAFLNYKEGNYEQAEVCYAKSLVLKQVIFGEEHLETADASRYFALALTARGNYSLALIYYEKALFIKKRKLPANHYKIYRSYYDFSLFYIDIGKYKQAITQLVEIMEILKKDHPNDYITMAYTHIKMNYLHYLLGHYQEAKKRYENFFKEYEGYFKRGNECFVQAQHGLGLVEVALGNHERGEALLLQALRAQQKFLGDHHPKTAMSWYALCIAHYKAQRYAESSDACMKALEIRIHFLGDYHPQIAHVYNMLATLVYEAEHNTYLAEEYYQKAIDIYLFHFKKEHHYLPIFYHNLAIVYISQGRYQEALKLYEEAFKIRQILLGPTHAQTIESLARVTWIIQNYDNRFSKSAKVGAFIAFFFLIRQCIA
ncbi:MAG: tetratricopeptide repeat protein [Bacteroidota bacterium]